MKKLFLALLVMLGATSYGQDYQSAYTGAQMDSAVARSGRTGIVYVNNYVTAGSGTWASPWTGWNTIAWSDGRTYLFSAGVYATSSTISIASKVGIHLIGAGMPAQKDLSTLGTVIRMTGTGNIIEFTGAHYGNSIENMMLAGNSNATNGLYISQGLAGCVRNLMIRDVSQAALRLNACTTTLVENVFVSSYGDVLSPCPTDGFLLEGQTTTTTMTNIYVSTGYLPQAVNMNGIRLNNSLCNTLLSGAFETCTGYGIVLENSSMYNTFSNAYTENDSLGGVSVGSGSVFNRFNEGYLYEGFGGHSTVTGSYTTFRGCFIGAITVESGAVKVKIEDGAATITDNGTGTIIENVYP